MLYSHVLARRIDPIRLTREEAVGSLLPVAIYSIGYAFEVVRIFTVLRHFERQ